MVLSNVIRLQCMEGWLIVCTTCCSVELIHPWLIWACVLITSRARTRAPINICIERLSRCWEQRHIIGCHHIMRSCMDLISKHASPQCFLSRFALFTGCPRLGSLLLIIVVSLLCTGASFCFLVVFHVCSRPICLVLGTLVVLPSRFSPLRCGWPSCPLCRWMYHAHDRCTFVHLVD